MNVNWSKVASIGIRVASVIVPQIGLIEQVSGALPDLKGKQKEDAVVALSHDAFKTVEAITEKDLLGDPEFDAAVRQFVQVYVALQNVIASRHGAAALAVPEQSTAAILEHKQQ